MSEKDGGSAFPVVFPERDDALLHAPGMTLRDYFAAQVIQRIQIDNDEDPEDQPTDEMVLWIDWQATYAYAVADAMLKARERP